MPLSTLRLKPYGVNRKTQGQDGVRFLLSRKALSSSTTCRFNPAHPQMDFEPRTFWLTGVGVNLLEMANTKSHGSNTELSSSGKGIAREVDFWARATLLDPPQRPTPLTQGNDRFDDSHLELIRHTRPPLAWCAGKSKWRIVHSSKWLVFKRPSLAGFERPLTRTARRTLPGADSED